MESLRSLSIESLVDHAVNQNPRVLSSIERWKASKAAVMSAWNLKNPQISYHLIGEEIQTRTGPQNQKFGISQKIPFPLKLPLRQRVAHIRQEQAAHLILHSKQMVRTQVITAYADLLAAQMQLAVLREEKSSLEQTASSVRSHIATGQKGLQDAAKIEAEIARLSERMLTMNETQVSAEERLNIALNQSREESWPLLSVPALPELEFDLKTLKELALKNRHRLMIEKLVLDEKKAKYELALMEYLPDFEVGFNYIEIGNGTTLRADDGKDAWSIPFKISVPLWEPQIRGKVEEAKAMKQSVEFNLEHVTNETLSFVTEQYTRFKSARQRVDVYRKTWIPQAEQALSSSRAALESGHGDMLNALDNSRMVLEARVGYWRSFADTLIGYAQIEKAVGFPLDEVMQVGSHMDHLTKDHGKGRGTS